MSDEKIVTKSEEVEPEVAEVETAPVKKKRGRKPKVKVEEAVENTKDVDTSSDNNQKEDIKDEVEKKVPTESTTEKDNSETNQEEKPKKKRTRRAKQSDVLDEFRDTRILLKGARQTMKLLTAMLERIEYNENMEDAGTAVTAVVQYNGFRILIPAREIGIEVDEELTHQEKVSIYRKYINPMLGANIDFVIMKVDDKNNIAVGSRRIAMAIKKKKIYQNRSRAGKKTQAEWATENSIPVKATVMAVAGSTVRIEVFGIETKVLARDADWIYTANLSDIFCPGDVIKCIIKSITVNPEDKNDIKITASIREAYPNRQIENATTFQEGSICIGEVTGVNVKGYYILLGDRKTGITGFCETVRDTEIPAVGDKVSCQIKSVSAKDGYAYVNILRIVQKKSRNHF